MTFPWTSSSGSVDALVKAAKVPPGGVPVKSPQTSGRSGTQRGAG